MTDKDIEAVARLIERWKTRATEYRREGDSVSWWPRLDGQAREAELCAGELAALLTRGGEPSQGGNA